MEDVYSLKLKKRIQKNIVQCHSLRKDGLNIALGATNRMGLLQRFKPEFNIVSFYGYFRCLFNDLECVSLIQGTSKHSSS